MKRYDAIVVGAGATGLWSALRLARANMDVLLLDAGPAPPAVREAGVLYYYRAHDDHPFETGPDTTFEWVRARHVGGRMLDWGRVCLRLSDADFKAASRDGHGLDWPLTYAELAPHYDAVEAFLRVSGHRDGLPQLPDGAYLPPPRMSPAEKRLKEAVESTWSDRHVIAPREANRGIDTLLQAALDTGRVTLRPGAVVRRVLMDDPAGLASGVEFVDALTLSSEEAFGKHVVLCASTLESTRILLNSSTPRHPDGLGNGSGVLGRYLMDHPQAAPVLVAGALDGDLCEPGDEPPGRYTFYIPNFRNLRERQTSFLRGYALTGIAGWPLPRELPPAFQEAGRAMREQHQGAFLMQTFGEMLPSYDNCVALSKDKTDRWGMPLLTIHCRLSENDRAMRADQLITASEMAEAAGFRVLFEIDAFSVLGSAIHEVGTARMGDDPKTSCLDHTNRCWEIENLYVADGACFVSGATQNPTLTMMALADRACAHLVARAQ